MRNKKLIYALQVASMAYIWFFVLAVAFWIINLIRVAHRLRDAVDASVAISIVAIPVFFILAAVLTYVFVGLQRGRK
jgi:arginine exporter protein ArgO